MVGDGPRPTEGEHLDFDTNRPSDAVQPIAEQNTSASDNNSERQMAGDTAGEDISVDDIKTLRNELETTFDEYKKDIATTRQLLGAKFSGTENDTGPNGLDNFFAKQLTPRERAFLIEYALSDIREVAGLLNKSSNQKTSNKV